MRIIALWRLCGMKMRLEERSVGVIKGIFLLKILQSHTLGDAGLVHKEPNLAFLRRFVFTLTKIHSAHAVFQMTCVALKASRFISVCIFWESDPWPCHFWVLFVQMRRVFMSFKNSLTHFETPVPCCFALSSKQITSPEGLNSVPGYGQRSQARRWSSRPFRKRIVV